MCKTYSTKTLDFITVNRWGFHLSSGIMGWELHIGPVLVLYWNKEYRSL